MQLFVRILVAVASLTENGLLLFQPVAAQSHTSTRYKKKASSPFSPRVDVAVRGVHRSSGTFVPNNSFDLHFPPRRPAPPSFSHNTRKPRASIPPEQSPTRRYLQQHDIASSSSSVVSKQNALRAVPPGVHTPIPPRPTRFSNSWPQISKTDLILSSTYFLNMFVMNLSVVTVPALAAASFNTAALTTTFEASVASWAPLGGAIGKIVNGFVVQRLGGRRASWTYLVLLATLSAAMSSVSRPESVAFFLVLFEFLSSIQWTAMCTILDEEYKSTPTVIARSVAMMSLGSYGGALVAKTLGAALLNFTGSWRKVTQCGSVVALVAAFSMMVGIPQPKVQPSHNSYVRQQTDATPPNPLAVLKTILSGRLFWMIGIGHSLGYIVRGSDRLLVPFLHTITGLSRTLCASLTSSVTLGLVLGLKQGTRFSRLGSVKEQMAILRRNYIQVIGSFFGLSLCSLSSKLQAPFAMAVIVSLLSGIAASSISFQFSQFPNLVSTALFSENKAVALSLVDAAGFFITWLTLGANTRILGNFGWSASWTYLSLFLCLGSAMMMISIEPVLFKQQHLLHT